MYRYTISFFFLVMATLAQGQRQLNLSQKDTLRYNEAYGLRLGIDLSRPVLSFLDEDYTGFELVADYRYSEKLFLAAEIGNEERTRFEDLYNYTSSGSYLKLGVDLNSYDNWPGEQNFITVGGRYAFSTFSQTLNAYNIFDSSRYYNPNNFVEGSTEPEEISGLNASWLEMVVGIKAELFANIYIGITARLGYIITQNENERLPNLWIPGFNRVNDGANWGLGYNYSISYFLPLYRKAKAKKKQQTTESAEQ